MEMPGTGISKFRGNIELVAQRNLGRTSHFIFWLDDGMIAQASTCCPWQAEMALYPSLLASFNMAFESVY